MDDPGGMRGDQRFGDVAGDIQALLERQGTATQSRGERLPFHQFHDQIGDVRASNACVTNIVQRADARVGQLRDRARFTLQRFAASAGIAELAGQHFDRDIAVEPCITRAIHLTHAASANQLDDLECAEAFTGTQIRTRVRHLRRVGGPIEKSVRRGIRRKERLDLRENVRVGCPRAHE